MFALENNQKHDPDIPDEIYGIRVHIHAFS